MKSRCYSMASALWQKKKYKRKDFGITELSHNDFSVETPDYIKEVHAHCKWCALFEVLAGED